MRREEMREGERRDEEGEGVILRGRRGKMRGEEII